MISMSFNDRDHDALLLEAAIVFGDNPTTLHSLAASNAVGKTPTTDHRLVDLTATVDGRTGALRR